MAATSGDWWIRYRRPIKFALLPLSAGWALANRAGLLGAPQVGDQPYIGPKALDFWTQAVTGKSVYLEYGAGGSTAKAVGLVPTVITVETDARYLAAVARKIDTIEAKGDFHPIHVDIGLTSKWGQPVIGWASPARLARWRRYPSAPWALMEARGLTPDFIFVDGRFRQASVLESFLRLPDGADCQFMLDDYTPRRTHYAAVAQFADEMTVLDTSVAFRRRRDFDRDACRAALEAAYADPL